MPRQKSSTVSTFRTFKCEACKRVFGSAWSKEEAERERIANFPSIPTEDCEVICGRCYDQMPLPTGRERMH